MKRNRAVDALRDAPSQVSSVLMDMNNMAKSKGLAHDYALIGGQALLAYGVPRGTLDADFLVTSDKIHDASHALVERFGWTPLEYDDKADDYIEAEVPVAHRMDDPVLFDVGEERVLYPFRAPEGLIVELLAAQHPLEEDMIAEARKKPFFGVLVPLAPLGGILGVKVKADRTKDQAAIEQVVEHLPGKDVLDAISWLEKRDKDLAKDLRAWAEAVWVRRRPMSKGRP